MTRRQTRFFFVAGTTVFALVFIGLTIDSHRQFGRLTHEENITEAVVAGKHVWHRKNCINCHTLLGEGGVLRAGSDQDRAVSRRRVPPAVPQGSVAILLRGTARPSHAEPQTFG